MTLSDFAGWNGLFLLIPLLIALVDVAKRVVPGMRKRVKPALALLFGLGLSLYLGLVLGLAPLEQLWWGLVAGLGPRAPTRSVSEWSSTRERHRSLRQWMALLTKGDNRLHPTQRLRRVQPWLEG